MDIFFVISHASFQALEIVVEVIMDTVSSDESENKYNKIDQTNPHEWNVCWQEISIVIIIKLV